MLIHFARHMEDIALAALPREIESEDESDAATNDTSGNASEVDEMATKAGDMVEAQYLRDIESGDTKLEQLLPDAAARAASSKESANMEQNNNSFAAPRPPLLAGLPDMISSDTSGKQRYPIKHHDRQNDSGPTVETVVPITSEGVGRNTRTQIRKMPNHAISHLRVWLEANQDNPYPDQDTRIALAQECGITEGQVRACLTNMRARSLPLRHDEPSYAGSAIDDNDSGLDSDNEESEYDALAAQSPPPAINSLDGRPYLLPSEDSLPDLNPVVHRLPTQKLTHKEHTKSRACCLNCRKRRIVCSEKHPECIQCAKVGLRCQYPKKHQKPIDRALPAPQPFSPRTSPLLAAQHAKDAASGLSGSLEEDADVEPLDFGSGTLENTESRSSRPEISTHDFKVEEIEGIEVAYPSFSARSTPRTTAVEGALQNDDIIKCLCGFLSDDGYTVLCEDCDSWQHVQCYYGPGEVQIPDDHRCIDCDPRPIDQNVAAKRQRLRTKAMAASQRRHTTTMKNVTDRDPASALSGRLEEDEGLTPLDLDLGLDNRSDTEKSRSQSKYEGVPIEERRNDMRRVNFTNDDLDESDVGLSNSTSIRQHNSTLIADTYIAASQLDPEKMFASKLRPKHLADDFASLPEREGEDDEPPRPEHQFTEPAQESSNVKRTSRGRVKRPTKTGCLTCRKRHINCNGERPICSNCSKSKRQCEGYNPRVVAKTSATNLLHQRIQEMREASVVSHSYEDIQSPILHDGTVSDVKRTGDLAVAGVDGITASKLGATLSTDENVYQEEETDEEGDEPRYCYCNEVSYGNMVACDNDDCPREWFHLACVKLDKAPAGRTKWFCSDECKEFHAKSKHKPTKSAPIPQAYTPQQKAAIFQLQSLLSVDRNAAIQMLESHNWDPQTAVNAYYSSGSSRTPTMSNRMSLLNEPEIEERSSVHIPSTASYLKTIRKHKQSRLLPIGHSHCLSAEQEQGIVRPGSPPPIIASRKMRASCDPCARSKIKCSKEKPQCSRCSQMGIDCNYSPSRRLGKPRATTPSPEDRTEHFQDLRDPRAARVSVVSPNPDPDPIRPSTPLLRVWACEGCEAQNNFDASGNECWNCGAVGKYHE